MAAGPKRSSAEAGDPSVGQPFSALALPRIGATNDDGEEEEESYQKQCVTCRALSPKAATAHTLISSTHGWRLERTLVRGEAILAWRCPRCWKAHRGGAGP